MSRSHADRDRGRVVSIAARTSVPVVPHCLELERRIVASLLCPYPSRNTARPIIDAGFHPDYLFRLDYRPIARVCIELEASGITPTAMLVFDRLTVSEREAIRGLAGLSSLPDGFPLYLPDQLAASVRDLADLAWRRAQIERVGDYHERLYDEDADVGRLQVEPNTWQKHTPHAQPAELLNDVSILQIPDRPYVIRGMLPAQGLAMIAGATGVGKSHIALSFAAATCLGMPWFGRYEIDTPGHVVIVAGEGAAGLKSRIIAVKQAYGCPLDSPLGIHLHLDGFSLQSDVDVSALLRRIPGVVQTRLVILDTWARLLLPGDENSQRDAGIGIAAMDKIRSATGATVVTLHHLNANGERERGSTALKAAVDTAIRIVPHMAGVRRVTCDKQRDSPPFEPFRFMLQPSGPSVVPVFDASEPEGGLPASDDLMEKARQLVRSRPKASNNDLSLELRCARGKALKALKAARAEQKDDTSAPQG